MSAEIPTTRNSVERAQLLADEIEADGLLGVAEEDAQYGTDTALIIHALRALKEVPHAE
jgi:hypothetical protein